MPRVVEYYFTLSSPWAYLGHRHFVDLTRRLDVAIHYRPMPVRRLFDETGGLPLPRRHPERQSYRLVDLQRWREKRSLPLTLEPRHVPFDAGLADRCVVALAAEGRDPDPYIRAAGAAAWAEERDLGDRATLASLLAASGHGDPDVLLARADDAACTAGYESNLAAALAAGVFGAPTYVLAGELFWGQDRLDLLEDALGSGRPPFRAG